MPSLLVACLRGTLARPRSCSAVSQGWSLRWIVITNLGPANTASFRVSCLDGVGGRRCVGIHRAQDHEGVVLEDLVLGQVLGVEAVVHREGVQPVVADQLRELLPRRIHHVEPGEARLGLLDHGADRHRPQIRLAAAAAPKPLSMLTTVTPAAQELSIPRSAARPPNEAP